jgi:hypothetical protein
MFLAKEKAQTTFMKKYMGMVIAAVSLFLFSFALTLTSAAYKSTPRSASVLPVNIDQVLVALRTGNATQLAKYFDSRVDISLPTKSDNFSKNQAEMILKDFFASNEVKDFQVKHKGENNGSQFCIGLLQTRNGNYRTKLYMKQKGGEQLVQEIAFQAEE